MAFAAGAEGRTGRGADARLVDQADRQRARIGKALDGEEQVERRLRLEEFDPAGREQPLAEDVARPAAALDLGGEERFAFGRAPRSPRAG